jgi:hypothetical protein
MDANTIVNLILVFLILLVGGGIFGLFWRLGGQGERGFIPRTIGAALTALFFIGAVLIW